MVLSQGGSSWSVARSRAHTLPMKLTFTFKKTSLKGLTSTGGGGHSMGVWGRARTSGTANTLSNTKGSPHMDYEDSSRRPRDALTKVISTPQVNKTIHPQLPKLLTTWWLLGRSAWGLK